MIFRIFIAAIALLCVYIAYDSAAIMWAKSSAHKAEDSQIQAAADADITVVEFLDYACDQCQNFHPVMARALERDGKIRYIVKPIVAKQDDTGAPAAKLVYAAGRQGKFFEAHNMLIENYRTIDTAYVKNMAAQLGLDANQLLKDMDDPKTDKILQKNAKNLENMKGKFIPSLLVNNDILLVVTEKIPSSDELLSLFNRARTL